MKYTVVEKIYKGYTFNSYVTDPKKRPAFDGMLDKVIERVRYASTKFREPAGFHIRFRKADNVPISQIMDLIRKHWARATPTRGRKKESTFSPVYFMAREVDHKEDGEHFHLMLILDLKKATAQSIYNVAGRLRDNGLVETFWICPPKTKKGSHIPLDCESHIREFIDWMGYLCKVYSKDINSMVRSSYASQIPKAGPARRPLLAA